MRAFLGFAVLSFGVSGIFAASAEPLASVRNDPPAQTVVRANKGDRLVAPRPEDTADRAPLIEGVQIAFAADSQGDAAAPTDEEAAPADLVDFIQPESESGSVHRIPLDEFCDVLISSARANDLPIVFFTNLIWQESRFDANSVSRAGAQGVAQFMPETAAANGLDNPFNPFQAVPASARLLRQLHEQFGNVGLAAAAYNAGPGRVTKWLSKRAPLPRETRAYVSTITGRPAEQWRGTGPQLAFKPAPDLPCSHTPAFAELKAAESQEDKAESVRGELGTMKKLAMQSFAMRSKSSSSQGASTVTIKGSNATIKGSRNSHRRLAARGALKITQKPVAADVGRV
jgi:hypothetical protein